MPDLEIYHYDEMVADLVKLTREMAVNNFKPDYILGIARGGLVPATYLSHYYKVNLLTATVSLRDGQGITDLSHVVNLLDQKAKILIVDDICDSGETLALIKNTLLGATKGPIMSDNLQTLVLWNNPSQDVFAPEYSAKEIDRQEDDSWIVFPWENWWEI